MDGEESLWRSRWELSPRRATLSHGREMRAEGHTPGSRTQRNHPPGLPIQRGRLSSGSSCSDLGRGRSHGGRRGFGLGGSVQVSGGSGRRLDFEWKMAEETAIAERTEPGKNRRRWEPGEQRLPPRGLWARSSIAWEHVRNHNRGPQPSRAESELRRPGRPGGLLSLDPLTRTHPKPIESDQDGTAGQVQSESGYLHSASLLKRLLGSGPSRT